MFMSMMMVLFLLLATMATFLIHPITMAGLLMLSSLLAALLMGKLISSWFMYMLILVFLGGVMVVLLFMVSLCSNEQFTPTPMNFLPALPLFLITIMFMNPTPNQMNSFVENQMMLSLYQNDTSWCFMLMVITLFICMISAISLSKIESGPLTKRL